MANYFKYVKNSFKWKHYINYIGMIIAIAAVSAIWLSGNLKLSSANLIVQIAFSIILAVSLNLVVGFLGELSLGHAGFMCIGAYLGGFLANKLYESIGSKLAVILIAMLFGGLVSAVFGLVIGLPALRLKGDYLAIVTLAFGEIVRNIFKNLELFGGAKGLETTKHLVRKDMSLTVISLVVVLVVLILSQNFVRSKHGRAVTAVRDNEIAAKAMGINVTYYKLFIFVISAFFAGVAGVLYSQITTPILYSDFSYNKSIELLVMVVLGGMGSINGSILAATLITFINTYLTTHLPGDFAALKYLIYAAILMVVVIFGNAPGLAMFREKYSLSKLIARLSRKIKNPNKAEARVKDDAAAWDRIPTKIAMDEVLSTDLKVVDSYTPDKPDKNKEGR